ncbi:MAG TPA: hypothetical protein VM889_07635 [Candidatus Thermoplasmatota archaeon]|nr:hypothetical protein [Candidatus Thermoplasmatota archaeon]
MAGDRRKGFWCASCTVLVVLGLGPAPVTYWGLAVPSGFRALDE